ncbi:hypothetical protein GCM10011331_02800 [Flavimobilis marinus]|uniref:DUF4440 domain-containing protein n=1 Tax=Flavimobilis marinus TaxID=285351 RepID=A0A1I2DTS2_9MICO|nr:nuclear transport factor 2 family protein [Flavimobilis marinus]GHG44379.1 hypothetical protein GCM10011331_02800 [Flavimobilis marinus]SFE83808.1 protein of unknown function [Flavimobilis marinus]
MALDDASAMLPALLDVEKQGWDALCAGTGADFYGERMTADGVMVLAHGHAMGRDDVVASLAEAPAWESYEITEPRAVSVGIDAVALVYRARATRGETTFEGLMTSVYTRVDGDLRLALYTQTPVVAG